MSDRYARQIVLPEVGAAGQARLGARDASLVVGAGGLGCAVLQYLCAAGVGRLSIVDHDRVEESNLHRQPLYRMGDLGQPKVAAARAALQALNPADPHRCARGAPDARQRCARRCRRGHRRSTPPTASR